MRRRIVVLAIVISATPTLAGCPPVTFQPSESVTPMPTPFTTSEQVATTQPTPVAPPTAAPTGAATAMPTQESVEVRVIVTGTGIAPSTESDPVRRERFAITAAQAVADVNFAKWKEGAEVESVTIVNQGTLETDSIRITVKAQVKLLGRMIKQHYDNATGKAEVTVEYVVNV